MEAVKKQGGVTKLGSIGGRSSSVEAGVFKAGPMITGKGNYRAGIGSHKDLRGGDVQAAEFKAGPMITGKGNYDGNVGSRKDLRGGKSIDSGAYDAGPMVTGKVK